MRPKPTFNAPTEKVEKSSSPQLSVVDNTNALIELLFNVKTDKKKNISRLNMKQLIALSNLFDLPSDAKCAVMKENLQALSDNVIKNKLSIASDINDDSDKVVSSDDSI